VTLAPYTSQVERCSDQGRAGGRGVGAITVVLQFGLLVCMFACHAVVYGSVFAYPHRVFVFLAIFRV
jgi:hypothetical protein